MKTLIILLALTLFSCEKCEIHETKSDYQYRVFIEESRKQLYYTDMFLKAIKSDNIKLMEAYCDSSVMANYCSNRAYKDMRKNN